MLRIRDPELFVLFWSPDPGWKKSGSGIWDEHPRSYFLELGNNFFCLNNLLKFFDADPWFGIWDLFDPWSVMEKFGSGIWYKHPGSATLVESSIIFLYFRSSPARSVPRRPYEGQLYPGEYPYKCSYCEKKFKQVGHVHQHERTHLGTQKYTCEHCDKKFNQLSHIRQVLCSRICSFWPDPDPEKSFKVSDLFSADPDPKESYLGLGWSRIMRVWNKSFGSSYNNLIFMDLVYIS